MDHNEIDILYHKHIFTTTSGFWENGYVLFEWP